MDPVRWSNLKHMQQSPAHYREHVQTDRPDTAAMMVGRATDALVFGGAPPLVFDGIRRGKVWDEFRTENAGREILNVTEYDRVRRMTDAVLASEFAAPVLRGERFAELSWSYLGRDCISHPDLKGADFITDLKSSNTVEPYRFIRNALKMGYHSQLAFYGLAVQSTGAPAPRNHYIVAVESIAPYPVQVYRLTDRAIEMGERLCRTWMERLLVCERNDEWPAYSQTILDIDIEEELELTFEDTAAA